MQLLLCDIIYAAGSLFQTQSSSVRQSSKSFSLLTNTTFLDTIVQHIKTNPRDVTLHVSGVDEWYETWNQHNDGINAQPFSVTDVPTWWRSPSFGCSEIRQSYEDMLLDYQFMSTGWIPGSEEELQGKDLGLSSLLNCTRRIPSCNVQVSIDTLENEPDPEKKGNVIDANNGIEDVDRNTEKVTPNWIQWPSNTLSTRQLYHDLAKYNYTYRTPAYVESDWSDNEPSSLIRALYRDDVLLPVYNLTSNSKNNHHDNNMIHIPRNSQLSTIFMYIGDRYSGTFLHQHGSSCSMSTGERIWILYDPHKYCDVNETLPKNMPKRCPRGEGRCMEGIHPLDILQHYFEMRELGVQPLLHLQKPGDIFCFPKHWFHGTINLEPNVVVSVVLSRLPDGPSNYCKEDREEWGTLIYEEEDGEEEVTLNDIEIIEDNV